MGAGLAAPMQKLGAAGVDGGKRGEAKILMGGRSRPAGAPAPRPSVWTRARNLRTLPRRGLSRGYGFRTTIAVDTTRGATRPRPSKLQTSLPRGFSGHVRRARRAGSVKLRSLGDFSGLEFHHFSGRRLHGSSRRHGARGTQGYPDAPVDGLALAWNELFGRSPRRPAPDSRVTRRPPVSPSLVSHPRGLLKAPSDGVQCIKNAPFGRQQFIYFPRPPGCYSVV